MEGVGESCCRCVLPGEWVCGVAEEPQGEEDGEDSEPQVAAPSQGGTGYPSLRVMGAWVLDAGEGRGPLGWGWGEERLSLLS